MLSGENANEFYAYVPKISLDSFDALICTLNDYCKKFDTQECAIIVSGAHSKRDGSDASCLIKILVEE